MIIAPTARVRCVTVVIPDVCALVIFHLLSRTLFPIGSRVSSTLLAVQGVPVSIGCRCSVILDIDDRQSLGLPTD
jgi:hypothetical protein